MSRGDVSCHYARIIKWLLHLFDSLYIICNNIHEICPEGDKSTYVRGPRKEKERD